MGVGHSAGVTLASADPAGSRLLGASSSMNIISAYAQRSAPRATRQYQYQCNGPGRCLAHPFAPGHTHILLLLCDEREGGALSPARMALGGPAAAWGCAAVLGVTCAAVLRLVNEEQPGPYMVYIS